MTCSTSCCCAIPVQGATYCKTDVNTYMNVIATVLYCDYYYDQQIWRADRVVNMVMPNIIVHVTKA